ncbi:low molecular weight protein-tyrosine-phosphatase [Prevotella nigrescens]|uniref:low molecular weight protein-tyrosine-phosphatase n=1 Tax=Prevotella nigrescens TaxID=28133 RepID=UPI003C730719
MNTSSNKEYHYNLLFICLGNICRSPAADAIMHKLVDDNGLSRNFTIDSAGIGNWHVGDLPDRRMREHGAKRGYDISHIARQFNKVTDFDASDYIIVMDDDNYSEICVQAKNARQRSKVVKMKDFFSRHKGETSVPDPYYGDAKDFEFALDLIEDGCRGLLCSLVEI